MSKVYAIRPPAVAGLFYPDQPETLAAAVAGLLPEAAMAMSPAALVVPHAGYRYCGNVAGAGYATLSGSRWRRVVLLGPPHQVPVFAMAAPGVDAFVTPLGQLPVDTTAIAALCRAHAVTIDDRAHADEHSIEVQLPFLQQQLGQPLIVPLLVGGALPRQVAAVLATLDDGDTLFIVSSDLSHFNTYDQACDEDRRTLDRVLAGAVDLNGSQACGCAALNGLNEYARRRHWQRTLLAYQNSGDTAGDKNRVVGYGAVAMAPAVAAP